MKVSWISSATLGRAAGKICREAETASRDRRNVDIVLSTCLREEVLAKLHYPVAFIEFLRGCIEHRAFSVAPVGPYASSTSCPRRLDRLLEVLTTGAPPLAFSQAQEIGLIADGILARFDPLDGHGDVASHFQLSSSFARKGRLLSSIVRFCQSERCLELGTAYGMSALFILYALKSNRAKGHLTTIEGSQPQFSIASAMLEERFGCMVSCQHGLTHEVLPGISEPPGSIDFVFHDADHSEDAYVRDFDAMSARLAPGSIVMFDDIRWSVAADETYRGWLKVIAHPLVKHAVEIDRNLGLVVAN
jgi:predicted O-methyltransferase YrrM